MTDLDLTAEQLTNHIHGYRRCVVAFSGGVDSALVAKGAYLALGADAIAVTAVSSSLATGELENAKSVAAQIGIEHRVIQTKEFDNPRYIQNAPDRCYHCKTELYDQIDQLCQEFPDSIVANGANKDDAGDYRPGLRAAAEHQVRSPLMECEFGKETVRQLAAHWNLPVWNKPAMPCLSSRIAYGEEVTPERLRMIDRAEQLLRQKDFTEVRVRYHRGDLARIEVPLDELPRLLDKELNAWLTSQLKQFGFRFVTIDLEGFRSGNLNTLVPLEVLKQSI